MAESMAVPSNEKRGQVTGITPSQFRKNSRAVSKSKYKGSDIVGNMACPSCRSRGSDSSGNHLILFSDGRGYCSRCPKNYSVEQVTDAKNGTVFNQPQLPPSNNNGGSYNFNRGRGYQSKYNQALTIEDILHFGYLGDEKRGITSYTDAHFGTKTEIDTGNRKPKARYYPMHNEGELTGYKPRILPKNWGNAIGTIKGCDLFGWHLCTGQRRTLIITEGEEDCLSTWQLNKRLNDKSDKPSIRRSNPHVVSLPNGTKGVFKILMHHIEELLKYNKIIWLGDNQRTDLDGAEALEVAIQVLGVDKFYVPEYPEHKKDMCDVLKMGYDVSLDVFADMYFNCEKYRPADIVDGSNLTLEDIEKEPVIGYNIPFHSLNEDLGGLRLKHLSLWTSGSGMGKSTVLRIISHTMVRDHGAMVGNIFLEESNEDTQQAVIAYDNKVSLKRYQEDFNVIPIADRKKSLESIISQMMFLDHNGDIDTDTLINKARYLYNKGCKYIILDHITMAVAGGGDMNESLVYAMGELYKFCQKNDVHVAVVVHLNKGPSGSKDVNRGGEITARHLLGSSALMQNSWDVITIRGNQMSDKYSNYRFFSILKTRKGRRVGICKGGYRYDTDTGTFHYDPDISIQNAIADDVENLNHSDNNTPTMGSNKSSKFDNKAS